MTPEDLKAVQDRFVEGGKTILLEHGRLRPTGFIITLHKHLDKLFDSGWGLEFIDPKACVRGQQPDDTAVLILDLLMDWKRLYHAILNVFPQVRDVLTPMLQLARKVDVDDPYMRITRPFLSHTKMDEKDVIAATMRQICGQVDAYACIMQTEAWLRYVDPDEDVDKIPARLQGDQKAFEALFSSMETYDFTRLLTTSVHREKPVSAKAARDDGKIRRFGTTDERLGAPEDADGRFMRFLKPLGIAS